MIMTTDFLSNWKTHVYSCLLLASEVYIHAYFCLWNIYSCLFLASEIYIYIKSEDGKEEEYVPSGWKFLSQLKYVLVFDDDGKVFLEYWFIFNYLCIESEDGTEEENDPSGWNLST